MNQYSELLRYLKQLGEEDVFVNTITKGDFTKVDLNKKNIFPLLHVSVGNGTFPAHGVIRFNVQIGCFDIRDFNKEINEDKFWDNDNEVDNHNETLSSLNRIWLKMSKDFEENNITASDNPSFEIADFDYKNVVDGWILSFDVDVPNVTLSLCQ